MRRGTLHLKVDIIGLLILQTMCADIIGVLIRMSVRRHHTLPREIAVSVSVLKTRARQSDADM